MELCTEPGRLSLVANGDPSAGATYPAVDSSAIAYLEIFPAVGIARFGDSVREYFMGPEAPGNTNPPAGMTEFRDSDQRIRRLAPRFRVYAYDAQYNPLGEVNGNNGYNLTWNVRVANTKGAYTVFQGNALRNPNVQGDLPPDERTRLIMDTGEQSITLGNQPDYVNLSAVFQGSNDEVTANNRAYLGQLQVDGAGRLIFVPGTGAARSVADPNNPQPELNSVFDNVDWFDGACDGWVRVQVTTANGFNMNSAHNAAVASGPPNFAWGLNAHCSLYDLMENIYPPMRDNYSFLLDIWPVLKSASLISWTSDVSNEGHGVDTPGHFTSPASINRLPDIAFRRRIFRKLRNPNGGGGNMPALPGDDDGLAAVTPLQYDRFRQWSEDTNFVLPNLWPPQLNSRLEDFALEDQPERLTRANAEPTIGSPFFPGIEICNAARESSTYDLSVANLIPPFRVDFTSVRPGNLTEGLCLPWQSDFEACGRTWWPSVRPIDVATNEANAATERQEWDRRLAQYTEGGRPVGDPRTQMTRYWNLLGIVRQVGNSSIYIEGEREPRLDGL